MNEDEAVARLQLLDAADPEVSHAKADQILLAVVPERVRQAYEAAQQRIVFWYA